MLVALLLSAACSFKDKGINAQESDADDFGGGSGGGGASGGNGGSAGNDGGMSDRPSSHADGSSDRGAPDDRFPSLDLEADLQPAPPDVPPPPPDAPGLPLGTACGADGLCDSGFCVDKVCCEKRCGDPCQSCSGLTNGATAGLCRPDLPNTACGAAMCSGSTHTPVPRCDGNGGCVPKLAAPCPNNLTCATATTCKVKCGGDLDCAGGMVCDVASGTCRPPGKSNGQACTLGNECSTGICADKVCCDVACTGLCRSCLAAQTGKPDGACANVLPGTKDARCPKDECHDGTCGGLGTCRPLPDGTRCATECCHGGSAGRLCAYQCENGACNRANPSVSERCGQGPGQGCCCPTGGAGGGPACTSPLNCPLGDCIQ
jgi:hypothetical protein